MDFIQLLLWFVGHVHTLQTFPLIWNDNNDNIKVK